NPAGAAVQVIGVGRPAAREPMAEAARLLGIHRAVIVSGEVPAAGAAARAFDEISLFGPTDVIDVLPAGLRRSRWTPAEFGLATAAAERLEELTVSGPAESAAAIRGVLAGEAGPRRDVVVLNAAATLWAAGHGVDLAAARRLAEESLDSAAAAAVLQRFAAVSQAG
ncbi:MAG: anthranilate phosphoribosyltransferase, partial [Planctomycetes bacterium]|nr:anthranilate phosphoribosyltransferase [Planctomycetota bacterium]